MSKICENNIVGCGDMLEINGVIFGYDNITWTNSVSGLIAPEITSGSIPKVNANGMYHGGNNYGNRTIVVNGSVTDEEKVYDLINKINSALSIKNIGSCTDGFKDITIKKEYGEVLRNRAKLVDGVHWTKRNEMSYVFTFTLELENFYHYIGCEDEEVEITSGCYESDFNYACDDIISFPLDIQKIPTTTIDVKNDGNYQSEAIIRIYGKAKNPVIGNKTTGEEARFEIDIPEGEYLEINTEKYTIISSNGCVNSNAINVMSGDLFSLCAGINEIYLYDECCSDFTAKIFYSNTSI